MRACTFNNEYSLANAVNHDPSTVLGHLEHYQHPCTKGTTKSQLQVSVELFHLKAYFDEKPQRMYWRYLSATIHSCFLCTFHMHMNTHAYAPNIKSKYRVQAHVPIPCSMFGLLLPNEMNLGNP